MPYPLDRDLSAGYAIQLLNNCGQVYKLSTEHEVESAVRDRVSFPLPTPLPILLLLFAPAQTGSAWLLDAGSWKIHQKNQ